MCDYVCYMYLCISTTTATAATTTTTTDFDKKDGQPLDFGEANNLALCSMLGFREEYIDLFFSILYHIFGPANMYGIWAHISCSDYMAMAKQKQYGSPFLVLSGRMEHPNHSISSKCMDQGYGSGVWIRVYRLCVQGMDQDLTF